MLLRLTAHSAILGVRCEVDQALIVPAGHGVGLQIHEAPVLSPRGVGRLQAGMAVTVEPGVYLADRGGVRIEDTLVVSDGEPELLTLTTKDLVAV